MLQLQVVLLVVAKFGVEPLAVNTGRRNRVLTVIVTLHLELLPHTIPPQAFNLKFKFDLSCYVFRI